MKKFKELDRKKRIIIISGISVVLLVAVVIIYRTYAIYQEKQDFDVIQESLAGVKSIVMIIFKNYYLDWKSGSALSQRLWVCHK